MNYKDFEQYNGKNINDFIEIIKNGCLVSNGKIGEVAVMLLWSSCPYTEISLIDDGTLIGIADENGVFKATDFEMD